MTIGYDPGTAPELRRSVMFLQLHVETHSLAR